MLLPSTHFPPQRLQRFSTYGLLKQMVFKMILEELAACDDVAAKSGLSPSLMASLKVRQPHHGDVVSVCGSTEWV